MSELTINKFGENQMKKELNVRYGKVSLTISDIDVDVTNIYKKLNNIGKITQSFDEADSFDNRLVIMSLKDDALVEGNFTSDELRKIAGILDEFNKFIAINVEDIK